MTWLLTRFDMWHALCSQLHRKLVVVLDPCSGTTACHQGIARPQCPYACLHTAYMDSKKALPHVTSPPRAMDRDRTR
jgi:hypothetical protein